MKSVTDKVEEFYKNEGIVIYIKGHPVIMIHPDNVENNVENLTNGNLKLNWNVLLNNVKEMENK